MNPEDIKKIEANTWVKVGEAKAKAFFKESLDILKVSELQEAEAVKKAIEIFTRTK